VLIAEVMYDPADEGSESDGEWLSLYNNSDGPIAISGWSLRDSKSTTALPAFELPAKAVALIAASERARQQQPNFAGVWVQLDARIGNGLGNSGDELALLDGGGQMIDGVSWGSSSTILDPAARLVTAGTTLKRRLPQDTDSAADWEPVQPPVDTDRPGRSGDGADKPGQHDDGTKAIDNGRGPATGDHSAPISTNTGPGRIIFSEIASESAWIELYNPQPQPQSLNGWQLDDEDPATTPLSFKPDAAITPHGFLVLEKHELDQIDGKLLRLMRPDGSLADMLSYNTIAVGTSLSRYPVHGGGWQLNTPSTRGTFNQAPPRSAATPIPQTAGKQAERVRSAQPADSASVPTTATSQNWSKTLLPPLLALALIAAVIAWSWRPRAAEASDEPRAAASNDDATEAAGAQDLERA
jgi:hypothetical protein